MITADTQGRQATVAAWKDRMVFVALSGRGLLHDDPEAFLAVLPVTADDDEMARTLHAALDASRFLESAAAMAFFQFENSMRQERMARLAAAVGASSVRALTSGMRKCWARQDGDTICLKPTRRLRGPAWEGLSGLPALEVSRSALPSETAAAIREAISLCVG
jgi:hypothetical protein